MVVEVYFEYSNEIDCNINLNRRVKAADGMILQLFLLFIYLFLC